MFNQIINKASFDSKNLFLLDGFGALLSAFLLGIVLVRLEKYFGIPPSALYLLASFPVLFALYDFYVYRRVMLKQGQSLKLIAVANILYCCLSLGVLFYHYETITFLGWTYIFVEIIIVIILSYVELKVASRLKN